MDAVASDSDLPGGRLNEMVEATNWLWWFTESGVLPGPNLATAESGIIVSFEVDTAAPDDDPDLPLDAIEFVAELRTEASESCVAVSVAPPVAALVVADAMDVVVEFVDAAPLAVPPDVLM
jgi:hypothetical protein